MSSGLGAVRFLLRAEFSLDSLVFVALFVHSLF
jgi:hypothetical protein